MEADGLAHPAEDGDVPDAAVGDADGGFLPRDDSLYAAQIYHQIVGCVGGAGDTLQNDAVEIGFFQLFPAHAGALQLRRKHALGVICMIHSDSSLIDFCCFM